MKIQARFVTLKSPVSSLLVALLIILVLLADWNIQTSPVEGWDNITGLAGNGSITATDRAGAAPDFALSSVLLSEDFEDSFPPDGWTVINNGGNCVWGRNDDIPRPNYAGSDGFSAAADADICGSGTTMNTELRTPVLDLSAVSSVRLDFVAVYRHHGSGSFRVLASGDSGATWDTLLTWTSHVHPEGPGQTVTLDLAAYSGSSEVIISFRYVAGNGWWAQVDQVRITETVYGLELEPAVAGSAGTPGETVAYTLTLTNMGNVADSFDITASEGSWEFEIPDTLIEDLEPGESATVWVNVLVPEDAAAGAIDAMTVTAASQGDPSESASSTLTTTAEAVHGVDLWPEAAAQAGLPGETVIYELTVTNEGNTTDSFAFTASGHVWSVDLPDPVTLVMGASVVVEATVTIPAEVWGGSMDVAMVTATSAGDPIQSASSELTTTAEAFYGVSVEPAADAKTGAPGATVEYTLQVTNEGNLPDAFSLVAGGNAWVAALSAPTTGELLPGQSFELTVTVLIPAGAADDDSDTVTVTATSVGGLTASASATLATTAGAVFGVDLSPAAAAQSGLPGETVVYELTVTNTGNASDSFSFSASSHVWSVDLPGPVTLAMGASTTVEVQVTIPANAPAGAVDTVTVVATSQNDPSAMAAYDLTTLTTTAGAGYGVELSLAAAAQSGLPGETVVYELMVTNTGNASDSFSFSASGHVWSVDLPDPVTLAMGASTTVEVQVTIAGNAAGWQTDVAVVTVKSDADESKSASSTLTTTALPVFNVQLLPAMDAKSGRPGSTVIYTLELTNLGTAEDVINLTATGWATLPVSSFTLDKNASTIIAVHVNVPPGVPHGTIDNAVITATSTGNPGKEDTSQVTTTAVWAHIYLPVVVRPAEWLLVGDMPAGVTRFYDVTTCDDQFVGGTDNGLYVLDTSHKWQHQEPISELALRLAFVPGQNCRRVYVGTLGQGLWLGIRNGDSWDWQQVNSSGSNGNRIWSLTIRNNVLFIGGDFGIRYADISALPPVGDHQWQQTTVDTVVTGLTHPTGSGVIYAAVWNDGVYTNGGGDDAAWNRQGALGDPLVYESMGGSDGTALVAGTQGGLYVWRHGEWNLEERFVNTTFAVQVAGNTLYAGQRDAGVIVSYDGGATWSQMNAGMQMPSDRQFQVRGFFVSPDGAYLYAATTSGVWRWPLP
jgi:uncharacterized membrane protein